jgi:hypothetical protein
LEVLFLGNLTLTNLNFYVTAVDGSNPFLLLSFDPFFDGIHLAELRFNCGSWLKTLQESKAAFSSIFYCQTLV